jgi:hypothetical protein
MSESAKNISIAAISSKNLYDGYGRPDGRLPACSLETGDFTWLSP